MKPFLEQLTPLTELASQVEEFASRCLPDFIYNTDDLRNLAFIKIDLSEFMGEDVEGEYCGLQIDVEGRATPHVFTRWARSQLLSHLGCREKWFDRVTRDQEVSELNQRTHALRPYLFRTMRSYDNAELLIVRGFVSKHFADIPDPSIMKALVEVLPSGLAVSNVSGKTDRAFYAYSITNDKISVAGTDFVAFPGVVVKNSEVGYSSLWVAPMMYVPSYRSCIILSKHPSLRKVHRGVPRDLKEKFEEALEKAKVLWGSLEDKFHKLTSITYASEDAAAHALVTMLSHVGAEKAFANDCVAIYRSEKHTSHDAFNIFKAIMVRVEKECDKDDAYVSSELAGAVLIQILK